MDQLLHVEERLAQRVTPADADTGFELLRDRARLMAFVLAQTAASVSLQQVERVALPLNGKDNPPHVLVDIKGHGITCLAAGMHFDVPVIPWPQVSRYLDQTRERFKQKMAVQGVRAAYQRGQSPAARLVTYAYRMTRAEFDLLNTLAPLMAEYHVSGVLEFVKHLTKALRKPFHPKTPATTLEAFWRLYSSSCVSVMMMGRMESMQWPCAVAGSCGDVLLATRGLWWLVNRPESTLQWVQASLDRVHKCEIIPGTDWALDMKLLASCAVVPLHAIALRFEYLRRSALDMLAQLLVPYNDQESLAHFTTRIKDGTARRTMRDRLGAKEFPGIRPRNGSM